MDPPDYFREISAQAELWRNFNRYYFNRLRELRAVNSGQGFHSTELRVLREIGEAPDGVHNAYIAWKVNVDRGQVSRIVAFFRHLGWIEDWPNPADRRMRYFALTPAGRHTYRRLESRGHGATEFLLEGMRRDDRLRFVAAFSEVQRLLLNVPF